jgi:hypothetical protein
MLYSCLVVIVVIDNGRKGLYEVDEVSTRLTGRLAVSVGTDCS